MTSNELLMMVIRSGQLPADLPGGTGVADRPSPLMRREYRQARCLQIISRLAGFLRRGLIRAQLHVGQPRAQQARSYLAAVISLAWLDGGMHIWLFCARLPDQPDAQLNRRR